MTASVEWDPGQYNKFAAEREQPFWDLARLLQPVDSPIVADLGCGDGRLTAALNDELDAASTVGVDSSPAMIAAASDHGSDRVRFESGDIGRWGRAGSYDIVFANASLQWVPDHPDVLARWADSLRPGGQLAVQVPTNADHATHRVAGDLAAEWMEEAPPDPVGANVLAPERYSELLNELGFEEQLVRLQVYGHHLSSTSELVEWVKGTTLTRFKQPLGDTEWFRFVDAYRQRLLEVLGDRSPYFYPFKRILLWGRRTPGTKR
jgi:trans-aconitate 2-methyltransferase